MTEILIIALDLATLFGVAWWLYGKQTSEVKFYYWPALSIKLLAGLAVGWLYFFHYGGGDTITYWHDGTLLSTRLYSDPLGVLKFFWSEDMDPAAFVGLINDKPRSLFFVKISGILALLSGGNYWAMGLIISFVSFLGSWYLFLKTLKFFPASRVAAAISFLFYPSIVFWSSGLIKESLGLAALFFLTGFCLTLINHNRTMRWEWAMLLLSLWIGWNLKYYWIGVFLPVSATTVAVVILNNWRPALKRYELILWTGLFIVSIVAATHVHPNFYPARFPEVICQNNHEFMAMTDLANAVEYDDLNPSFSSILRSSPKALVAGLFRPFLWEAHNFLSVAAGFENLILLLLALSSLPGLLQFFRSDSRVLILAVIVYIVMLAIFLALSTPNFGTLARYKIGFLPFAVFLMCNQNPFITRLKRWK